MKRTEDVFFFTLIDFLIQVFFFGLLLYVLVQVGVRVEKQERDAQQAQINRILSATGVTTLAELTDILTKLVPASDLSEISEIVKNEGGLEHIRKVLKVVADVGGPEKLSEIIEKWRQSEQGSGRPPCVFDIVEGRRNARALGRVAVTDTHIRFETKTADLDDLLQKLGYRFEDIQALTLKEFRERFARVKTIQPDCRYHLDTRVSTKLLAPMDTVWSAFQISHRL